MAHQQNISSSDSSVKLESHIQHQATEAAAIGPHPTSHTIDDPVATEGTPQELVMLEEEFPQETKFWIKKSLPSIWSNIFVLLAWIVPVVFTDNMDFQSSAKTMIIGCRLNATSPASLENCFTYNVFACNNHTLEWNFLERTSQFNRSLYYSIFAIEAVVILSLVYVQVMLIRGAHTAINFLAGRIIIGQKKTIKSVLCINNKYLLLPIFLVVFLWYNYAKYEVLYRLSLSNEIRCDNGVFIVVFAQTYSFHFSLELFTGIIKMAWPMIVSLKMVWNRMSDLYLDILFKSLMKEAPPQIMEDLQNSRRIEYSDLLPAIEEYFILQEKSPSETTKLCNNCWRSNLGRLTEQEIDDICIYLYSKKPHLLKERYEVSSKVKDRHSNCC